MKCIYTIFFCVISSLVGQHKDLPKPYSDLSEVFPPENQGWYGNHQPLSQLFKEKDIQIVIEVGS